MKKTAFISLIASGLSLSTTGYAYADHETGVFGIFHDPHPAVSRDVRANRKGLSYDEMKPGANKLMRNRGDHYPHWKCADNPSGSCG
ncbi:MAG: hypothetical protein U1E20_10935 [Methylocystis sp.]|jgi:hypothetical protein|uniref:hypothetical protein n=1 Tax=Methylocystis sp. TaxID=1911079 RepID=UPI00392376CB